MKYNKNVSSARRKQRKAHFSAPSHERRIRMSAMLSKELRAKHGIRSAPIRRDDEVTVVRGTHANRDGKVVRVHRTKYAIHIDKITRDKINGQSVTVAIHPSNVVITKLKDDSNRNKLLTRRAAAKGKDGKAEKGVPATSAMATVD